MPRKKATHPKSLLKAWIPMDLRAQLDLALVSEVEGRVPLGRYSEFVAERLREHFSWTELDLGLYGFPTGYFVRGPLDMLAQLRDRLIGKCLYEARQPDGGNFVGHGAVATWCRTHGFTCPNLEAAHGAKS